MPKDILTMVDDGDENSPHVNHGIELARENGATIHGIYVIDAWRFGEYTVHGWDELVRETHEDESNEIFTKIEEKCEANGVDFEWMTTTGKPVNTIIDYTRNNDIGRIICSEPRGHGGNLHSPKMIERLKTEANVSVECI